MQYSLIFIDTIFDWYIKLLRNYNFCIKNFSSRKMNWSLTLTWSFLKKILILSKNFLYLPKQHNLKKKKNHACFKEPITWRTHLVQPKHFFIFTQNNLFFQFKEKNFILSWKDSFYMSEKTRFFKQKWFLMITKKIKV